MVLSFPIQRPDTHTSILLILLAFVFIASYFVHTSHHLTPPPVHGHSHNHHLHHAKHAHSHARTLFRTGIIHHHTRIAICFSGSLRTFATTMYWYKMKLIRPLLSLSGVEIHIFAHVWKEMEPVTSPTSSPPLSAEHLVRSIFTAHDLITHVRAITSDSIDDVKNLDEWKALEKITRGRANDKESKDPTRLLLQHWSLRAANRLKREYEISKGWMFTWVYRCRYDMLIRKAVPPFFVPTPSKPLPPLLAGGTTSAHSSPFSTLGAEPEHLAYLSQQAQDQQARLLYNISHLHTAQIWQQHWVRGVHAWMLSPNHIYVPSCEWWGGIADMFALGSSHLMDVYSERMDVKQLQIYLNTFESSWHPETYLMWSLTVYHNISVLPFPICFSILRQADDARYTELPRGICAYGNTKYKGRGCCRIHCRKGDRHCFPDDWEKDGNANSIANPLVADIAPTTYNVTDVTAVLAECIKQYIKPADRTKYCEPKYVTELVERNAYIRKETYARCPPLEI